MQAAGVVTEADLKERISEESLQEAGLIKSAETVRKKISLLRTGKVYSQQKYNLLREENEGFSKLVWRMIPNLLYMVYDVHQTYRARMACFADRGARTRKHQQ
jgi:hypothetical protein